MKRTEFAKPEEKYFNILMNERDTKIATLRIVRIEHISINQSKKELLTIKTAIVPSPSCKLFNEIILMKT